MGDRYIPTRRWAAAIVAPLLIVLLVVLWPWLALVFAVLTSETRPGLLTDADWNRPESAIAFNTRFAPGTLEVELLDWLRDNRFELDRSSSAAKRLIHSIPCNEAVDVSWIATAGKVQRASATVREAGCL